MWTKLVILVTFRSLTVSDTHETCQLRKSSTAVLVPASIETCDVPILKRFCDRFHSCQHSQWCEAFPTAPLCAFLSNCHSNAHTQQEPSQCGYWTKCEVELKLSKPGQALIVEFGDFTIFHSGQYQVSIGSQ